MNTTIYTDNNNQSAIQFAMLKPALLLFIIFLVPFCEVF